MLYSERINGWGAVHAVKQTVGMPLDALGEERFIAVKEAIRSVGINAGTPNWKQTWSYTAEVSTKMKHKCIPQTFQGILQLNSNRRHRKGLADIYLGSINCPHTRIDGQKSQS